MILADTSVWIDHLNGRSTLLPAALTEQLVVMHPFIIGEIVCASFPARAQTLQWLENLPRAPIATHGEVMALIERRRLMGAGIGYIDAHLLASVILMKDARLMTSDKRLALVAAKLKVAYRTPPIGS